MHLSSTLTLSDSPHLSLCLFTQAKNRSAFPPTQPLAAVKSLKPKQPPSLALITATACVEYAQTLAVAPSSLTFLIFPPILQSLLLTFPKPHVQHQNRAMDDLKIASLVARRARYECAHFFNISPLNMHEIK